MLWSTIHLNNVAEEPQEVLVCDAGTTTDIEDLQVSEHLRPRAYRVEHVIVAAREDVELERRGGVVHFYSTQVRTSGAPEQLPESYVV